jgi:hypothetical protein
VLDYFIVDEYSYGEYVYGVTDVEGSEGLPMAGKFLVVNYSVRNTGQDPIEIGFEGGLLTGSGESYEESDNVFHPNALLDGVSGGFDLAPRQLELGQFIFDVPADTDAESLTAAPIDLTESADVSSIPAQIDLTDSDRPGAEPEEILALQYEYSNMSAWDRSYELFAQQSKDMVSLDQYASYFNQQSTSLITEYSFPSVTIQGETATIERIFSYSAVDDEGQDTNTQEAVLEADGWRIVMREDQIDAFLGQQG